MGVKFEKGVGFNPLTNTNQIKWSKGVVSGGGGVVPYIIDNVYSMFK